MKKRGLYAILLGMAAMSFSFFNSCNIDIGLGAAVDTDVPTLKIENPPTAAIIRDPFQISGSWKDDGTIKSIKVELKNSDPNIDYSFTYDGKSYEDGTWDANIDPIKSRVPDGKYEATVTITDNGGHSSNAARSYVIDNTPPVIILERPSTIATDDDSDLFGQKLTFKGQAADNNDVSLIRITFYADKECTIYRHQVDLTNVPPTIDMDVATFEASVDNDYSEIYDSKEKDGKKPLYYTIEAYDGASRYDGVNPVDKSGLDGNKADFYYQYDAIYKLLSQYKATGLYNILNGTYSPSSVSRETSPVDYSDVKDTLLQKKNKIGRFSLNPANNPEFKVVGREALTKNEENKINFSNAAYSFTNESNISLKVTMGLDSIPVVKESLKVYLLNCDDEGNVDDAYETETDSQGNVTRFYKNRIYPAAEAVKSEPSDGGYTFTAKINAAETVDYKGDIKRLEIGETYIIAIEGYDQENNEVVAEENNLYGFKLAPNGAAPIVEIKTCLNPNDATVESDFTDDAMIYVPRYNPANKSEETTISFKGTIQVGDGTPTLAVKINNGPSKDLNSILKPIEGKKGHFSFAYDVPVNQLKKYNDADELVQDYTVSGQHNIVFTSVLSDETVVKKSIMYQVEAPKVTISSVEPVAYKYIDEAGTKETDADGKVKKFLNGKNVKFGVTIIAGVVGLNEDDEDKKPKIEFLQKDSDGNFTVNKLTLDAPTLGETSEIDTTKFEQDELLVRITAYDMAGNKTVVEENFYVDQSTDNPVILPKKSENSTLDLSEETVSEPTYKAKNVYSANQTITYKLIDDDGLESAYYEITKAGETEPLKAKEDTEIALGNTPDYQMDVNMLGEPAVYKVVLYTKDSIPGTTPNIKEFYVRVTAADPTIQNIKLTKTNFNNKDTISPQIKIKSDQIPFILTRTITNPAGQEISELTQIYKHENPESEEGVREDPKLNTSSPEITDGILIDSQYMTVSGKYTINYTVEDRNGKKGTGSTEFVLDLGAPKISKVKIAEADYDSAAWYNSKTLVLDVTASDGEGETDIAAVEYSTKAGDSSWTALSNDNGDIWSGSAVFANEGPTNVLYIRARDGAGNNTYFDGITANGEQSGTAVAVNVQIDTSAPNLTVTKYKVGNLAERDIDKSKIYVNGKTGLTISGTLRDAQSGVNSTVTIYKEVTETVTDPDTEETTETVIKTQVKTCEVDSKGNWSVSLTKDVDFIGKIIIEGKNSANAESSVSPFEVILDNIAPEITNISLEASNKLVSKKSATEYFINNKEGDPTFNIAGIATDGKGVDKVTLYINGSKKAETEESDFTFTINNSDLGGKKSIPVKLIAEDIAGNECPKEFTIKVDTSGPVGKHLLDTSGKDLYFRIGDHSSDEINDSSDPKFTTTDDSDVGGKYYEGTYGNTTTVKIRGIFEDSESGLQRIYYKIFNGTTTPTETQINDFLADYEQEAIDDPTHVGYISAKEETKRVFYSDKTNDGSLGLTGESALKFKGPVTSVSDGASKYYTSITTNYKEMISGFESGTNFLVLVAVDNVGNAAVDKSADNKNYFQINVDTLPPMISSAGEVYTNCSDKLPIAFKVSDLPNTLNAGVKTVTVTFNDIEYPAEYMDSGDYIGKYLVEVPKDKLPKKSDSYPISVTAMDWAGSGNKSEGSGGTVIVDKGAPTVSINTITDADKTTSDKVDVNGIFELSGTAGDAVQLSSVDVEYKKDVSSVTTWIPIGRFTGNAAYNWTVSFNTTEIDDGEYIIRATAKDAAGNENTAEKSIYIIQDSDRPVIKLMSLELPKTVQKTPISYKNSELTGIISDDDGVPVALAYRIGATGDFIDSADSNKKLTYSATDGQFTLNLDDSESSDVYFKITTQVKVKDTDGNDVNVTFETKPTSDDLNLQTTPKLTDKKSTKYGYKTDAVQKGTVLKLRVDTTAPAVDSVGFSVDASADGKEWPSTVSSQTFGGTHNTFYLNQFVYDAVAIKSVTVEIAKVTGDDKNSKHSFNFAPVKISDEPVTYSTKKINKLDYTEYRSEQISVAGLKSGTREFTIKVSDSVSTTTSRVNINIDNDAPVISFTGPSSTTTSSGSITAYGTVDSDSDVYYAVSTSNVKPGTSVKKWTGETSTGTSTGGSISDIKDKDGAKYQKINDASLSWFVYFDGLTASSSGTHAPVLNNYLIDYGITTAADLAKTSGAFDSIVNLYVWIKSVDRVGNESETYHLIKLDPQGDRPTVAVSYPSEDGQTLGGTVRVTGSANDEKGTTIGVNSVWVQLISKKHNDVKYTENTVEKTYSVEDKTFGDFTAGADNLITASSFKMTKADLDYLHYAGYPVKKMSDKSEYNPSATEVSPSDYAILATLSGSSWSITLNNKSEFNPASGTNGLAMRVYAKDMDGKLSVNTDKYMVFDSSNPIIGSSQALYLVKSADNSLEIKDSGPDFKDTASREYIEDMFVKGDWWLIGSVEDNDAIKTLKIGNDRLIKDGEIQDNNNWMVVGTGEPVTKNNLPTEDDPSVKTGTISVYKTVYFKYKLTTTKQVDSLSYVINAIDAADGTPGNTSKTIVVNVDNVAPTLAAAGSSAYNLNKDIHQDQGYYYMESMASEPVVGTNSQSELDSVAFFFIRKDKTMETEVDNIFNPMIKGGNPVSTSGLTYAEDGLYWKKVENVGRSDDLHILTNIAEDPNIRKNGLVKIGGYVYKITDINGTSVTINGNPKKSETTAYFAYALLIDNTIQETGGTATKTTDDGYLYPQTITNDDGDGFVEYIKKSSTNFYWSASIVSSNIPDGPIELHYVAFDKAGNYSIGKMENAFISNNAPRLAGVIVATDTDGNGSINEADEKEWFTDWSGIYDTWEKAKTEITVPADSTRAAPKSVFTTKGLTRITPEIIGGNGKIKYNYTVAKRNAANTDWADAYYTKSELVEIGIQPVHESHAVLTNVSPIEFTVKDFLTKDKEENGHEIEDAVYQKFSFTIWDSTDATVCGTNSQKTQLDVIMSVALRDEAGPSAAIKPIFWNSLNDNSIYGSDSKDEDKKFIVKSVDDLAGHVELENADNPRPDLSGKVVLRGTASDEKMVKKLYISIPEMATKFAGISGMTKKTVSSTDYYLAAAYDSATSEWTTYGSLADNGFDMNITKSEFTATGHSVEWEFIWDTSAISATAPAKKNIVVKVLAEDEGKPTLSGTTVSYVPNKSAEGTSQTGTANTAMYTVDVVPYITSITRGSTISGGAMNRSKLGSYPVSEGETLTVTGFNLIGGTWTVGRGHTEQTAQPTGAANIMNGTTKTGKDSFTMTVPEFSGELKVTVGGVDSVNNTNRTELEGNKEKFTMSGSSAEYISTDNRYLSIWNLGNYFNDTQKSLGKEFEYPVMTSSATGNLYASWGTPSNGSITFSYGLKKNSTAIYNAYDQPGSYTGVAFDQKSNSGAASVMYMAELQGNGGTYSVTALASTPIIGGAVVTQIKKDDIDNSKVYKGKTDVVSGNPGIYLDGDNTTGFYSLQNYDMQRRLGIYKNPQAARFGNYLHNIWYDSQNESLKYSVINLDEKINGQDLVTAYTRNAAFSGWVLIDGNYTAQDRLYEWTSDTNSAKTNNQVGGADNRTGTQTGVGSTSNPAVFNKVIFLGSNTNKDHNKTRYIGNRTKTSIEIKDAVYATDITEGDTIALLQNDMGAYKILLRTIKKFENKIITWEEALPDGFEIDSATIYQGDMNVVGGNSSRSFTDFVRSTDNDLKSSTSAGLSAAIDVDNDGSPVIAYYDASNSELRVACASVVQPKLASQWTRFNTGVTCSGEVSMKVDGANNLHIMYNNGDGQMCYLFGKYNSVGNYTWGKEEVVDDTGSLSYGSISVIYNGTTYVPAMTWLNKANTANAIKYAYRTVAPAASNASDGEWDFMIIPALGNGHYALKENKVSIESSNNWTKPQDVTDADYANVLQNELPAANTSYQATATPATVTSVLAYKTSNAYETAYLKTE